MKLTNEVELNFLRNGIPVSVKGQLNEVVFRASYFSAGSAWEVNLIINESILKVLLTDLLYWISGGTSLKILTLGLSRALTL